MRALSFSGHRPPGLGGYNSPTLALVENKLLEVISRSYDFGFTRFIFGGALGTDQLAMAAGIRFQQDGNNKCELFAAIPFQSYHVKWPERSKAHYFTLLNQMDEVFYINDDPYESWKLHARNKWMVDNSELLVAVSSSKPGGTMACMRYAAGRHRATLIIDPTTLAERWDWH